MNRRIDRWVSNHGKEYTIWIKKQSSEYQLV